MSGGTNAARVHSSIATAVRGRLPLTVLLLTLLTLVSLAAGACTENDAATTTTATAGTAGGSATTGGDGATSTTEDSTTTQAPGAPAANANQTETDRLSPAEGPFASCRDCHAYLDPPGQVAATLMANFKHEKHLSYDDVTCQACHSVPAHQTDGIRKPLMADCFTCHGQAEDARAPGACELCHPADFPRVPSTHTASFRKGGHTQVAEQQGARECVICHEGTEETVCSTCHRVELPHPEGWNGTGEKPGDHVAAAHEDAKACAPCHDNRLDQPGGCFGGECHGS